MGIFLISLIVAIVLESTIITLPLVLLLIIFAAVTLKNNDVFILAFLSGLLLDVLTLGTIGLTSAFYVLIVMLIFLYQKKFEIESVNFVSLSAFLGSFIYLFMTNSNQIGMEALSATLLMFISYIIFKKTIKKVPKYLPAGRQGV